MSSNLDNSLSGLMRRVELAVRQRLSSVDMADIPKNERVVLEELKRIVPEAKLDLRDYELAETRAEQLAHGKDALQRIATLREHILLASGYGFFGAADVAQITATLEQITELVD
ncbi:MAG: hypothetical protein WBP26_05130 [Candidatus Saccharimonadales bacterium]